MGEKLIAVNTFYKMDYIYNGIQEYTMFYNELVRKNNHLYKIYVSTRRNIDFIERMEYKDFKAFERLKYLYEVEDELLSAHIKIYNTANGLKK